MTPALLSVSGLHSQRSLALQSLSREVRPLSQQAGLLRTRVQLRVPQQEVADEEPQAFSQQAQLRVVTHPG